MPREKESYRDVLVSLKERGQQLYEGKILYNITEAAVLLGIPRQTVYNNRKRYAFKDGYITLEQLARDIT